MNLSEQYRKIRQASEAICRPLRTEDYVVQPVVDVSPPKWHLGHTTWFWETFVLMKYDLAYKVYNPDYNYVFNSYYETIGARVIRTDRGNLSRPSVEEIYAYRQYVDAAMDRLLTSCATDVNVQKTGLPGNVARFLEKSNDGPSDNEPEARSVLRDTLLLGLHHEQQHQELLWTDIKYILGHNPLFPPLSGADLDDEGSAEGKGFVPMSAGIYEIGFEGEGFCFDNERARHKVYLNDYEIAGSLVTNEEFVAFIQAGGYGNFIYWHAEGWDWVKNNQIKSPLYWHMMDGKWYHYTLAGLRPLDMKAPVCHISYYEAVAYGAWKGMRLPTEWEWEAASGKFGWGKRWEWTESAYLPYPGFKKAEGAIGEYNGKFMVSQMVLRGASVATPAGHSRNTYRNFFHPHLRWQFTGIRLAR